MAHELTQGHWSQWGQRQIVNYWIISDLPEFEGPEFTEFHSLESNRFFLKNKSSNPPSGNKFIRVKFYILIVSCITGCVGALHRHALQRGREPRHLKGAVHPKIKTNPTHAHLLTVSAHVTIETYISLQSNLINLYYFQKEKHSYFTNFSF